MIDTLFAPPGENRSVFRRSEDCAVLNCQFFPPGSQNAVARLSRELSWLPVPRLPPLPRVVHVTDKAGLKDFLKLLRDLAAANHNSRRLAYSREGEYVADIEELELAS